MSSIRLKNNGGLVMPCASVVRTVHIAERKLRLLTLPGDKPMQLAKIWNINEKGTSVRQQMTKLVLFKNQ